MTDPHADDPRTDAPRAGESDAADELSLQIGGGPGDPERLLRISRPRDGLVRVLEWSSEGWNEPPLERELAAAALLEAIEEAAARRRRLSEELPRIRRWLSAGS